MQEVGAGSFVTEGMDCSARHKSLRGAVDGMRLKVYAINQDELAMMYARGGD